MRKLFTILAVLMLAALCGCTKQEGVTPSKTDEKVIKEVVVVLGKDGNLYVPNDDLSDGDEVHYKLEDGSEVTIATDSDLSASGEYQAEVTYVKDGQTVTENLLVLADSQDKVEEAVANAVTETTQDEPNSVGKLSWGDSGYGEVEINGTVYGFDDLNSMDWDTSMAWVIAVYGENGYEIRPGIDSNMICVRIYSGMPCEEMRKLAKNTRGGGGCVSLFTMENSQTNNAVTACGL